MVGLFYKRWQPSFDATIYGISSDCVLRKQIEQYSLTKQSRITVNIGNPLNEYLTIQTLL